MVVHSPAGARNTAQCVAQPVGHEAAASPLMCSACDIGKGAVYRRLLPCDADKVMSLRAVRQTVDAGRSILSEGEVAPRVYTLYDGWAYRYRRVGEGRRQVLGLYIPGDTISIRALLPGPVPFGVRALTKASLCGFPRQAYLDFIEASPQVRAQLLEDVAVKQAAQDELLIDIACRPAELRLINFLVSICERLAARQPAAEQAVELPLPQALVADLLGLTPVYVNRLLVGLRDAGLVELGRSCIAVPDTGALAKAYEERA